MVLMRLLAAACAVVLLSSCASLQLEEKKVDYIISK